MTISVNDESNKMLQFGQLDTSNIDYAKLSELLKPDISSRTFQEFFNAFLHKQVEKHAQEKELERQEQSKNTNLANPYGAFSVFVGNLPYSATEEELTLLFQQAGNVIGVRIIYDLETNRPRGYGFCDFYSHTAAENACHMFNGYPFGGRILRVNMATNK